MKRLSFKKPYIEPILSGEKVTTVRKHTSVKPGDLIAATCAWGDPPFAFLRVKEVDHLHLDELSDEDARDDGFEDRMALRKAIAKFYPEAAEVARVRFSVEDAGAT